MGSAFCWGHSLGLWGRALLDSSLFARNGRFSIVLCIIRVALAFICHYEPIKIALIIRIIISIVLVLVRII